MGKIYTIKCFLIQVLTSLILLCSVYISISNAQNDTLAQKYNSFRLKYDVTQWFCQYPSIEVEYRFTKRIAVNVTAICIQRGSIWPVKVITTGIDFDQYMLQSGNSKITEQWLLSGFMLKVGIKYYFRNDYFLTPMFYYKDISYENIDWGNIDYSYRENLSIKNYGLGIIFGNEGRKHKYAFGE